MTPKFDQVDKRLSSLISKADKMLLNVRNEPLLPGSRELHEVTDSFEFIRFRTAALHFIENTLGKDTQYYHALDKNCHVAAPYHVKAGKAILEEIREEFKSSWLWSTYGIAAAEVYADFLEMAEELLNANYKDAAAVMAGSVLEEHLRRLCNKNGITTTVSANGKNTPKKADTLNSELAGNGVYNKLDQKWVTTALDLRNKAAHGHYNEYDKDQVRSIMLQSITDFFQRLPV